VNVKFSKEIRAKVDRSIANYATATGIHSKW